jgi:hypothetical protein
LGIQFENLTLNSIWQAKLQPQIGLEHDFIGHFKLTYIWDFDLTTKFGTSNWKAKLGLQLTKHICDLIFTLQTIKPILRLSLTSKFEYLNFVTQFCWKNVEFIYKKKTPIWAIIFHWFVNNKINKNNKATLWVINPQKKRPSTFITISRFSKPNYNLKCKPSILKTTIFIHNIHQNKDAIFSSKLYFLKQWKKSPSNEDENERITWSQFKISHIPFKIANLHPFIQNFNHAILVHPLKYIEDFACNKFQPIHPFINYELMVYKLFLNDGFTIWHSK